MLVMPGGEVVPAQIGWRPGFRGRMRPRVIVEGREIEAPATVDVIEIREEVRELLAAAGFRLP